MKITVRYIEDLLLAITIYSYKIVILLYKI